MKFSIIVNSPASVVYNKMNHSLIESIQEIMILLICKMSLNYLIFLIIFDC